MMRNLFFLIFIFLVGQTLAQIPKDVIKNIDKVFDNVTDKTPGYVVGVIQGNSFLFKKGYGLANLEHHIKIDNHTSFNIASLSKQITAASLALLILEGKVALEDPVSKHIQDFPFSKDVVKVKHLVYMTSGINDYYYNPRENGTDWSSLHFFNVNNAIAASYGSGELMYKPGTQWSYSNINYMLITKIVSNVSGLKFSEFVQQRIFGPLRMENSVVNDDIFQVIPNRAMGYNYRNPEDTDWLMESGYLQDRGDGFLQIHRNAPHYGGSGIYTTLEDFKLWIENFHTKAFGGQEFYNLMHRTMKFQHDKSNDAFGLVMDTYKGQDVVWYEGGDWGFSSYMVRFVGSDTAIVCFSNIGTGNAKKKAWSVYDILADSGLIQ